jgi:hypothetical protein
MPPHLVASAPSLLLGTVALDEALDLFDDVSVRDGADDTGSGRGGTRTGIDSIVGGADGWPAALAPTQSSLSRGSNGIDEGATVGVCTTVRSLLLDAQIELVPDEPVPTVETKLEPDRLEPDGELLGVARRRRIDMVEMEDVDDDVSACCWLS